MPLFSWTLVRGFSALTSGLTTFPEAVGVLVSTQMVARLYPSIGPRRLIVGGLTGVAIVIALMSLIGQDTSLWLLRAFPLIRAARPSARSVASHPRWKGTSFHSRTNVRN